MPQPWTHLNQTGLQGEAIAEKFLRDRGFKILGRRFWTRWGEIDLIVRKKGLLTFVEVKTLCGSGGPNPLEAVTQEKMTKLFKASQIYLSQMKGRSIDMDYNFLGIGIQIHKGEVQINCGQLLPF